MGPQALAISSKDGSSLAASSSSKSRLRQPWVRRRHGITAPQSTWEQQRAPSSLQTSSCAHSRHAASAVSDPGYASSLPGVAARLIKEEGVIRGFYSGFGPILFKQVPSCRHLAVQGEQSRCRWRWLHPLTHDEHHEGDWGSQALHTGSRGPLRDDRNLDRPPVRHLRHSDEELRCREVPLPRTRLGRESVCMNFVTRLG